MRYWLLGLILFCVTGFSAPQTPPTGDQQALAALADVLDNPAQRAILIGELRKLSATATPASDSPPEPPAAANLPPPAPETPPAVDNSVDSETIKAVTANAKEAVATAVAVPKKMLEYSGQVLLEVGKKMQESWRALVDVFTGQDVLLKLVDPRTFLHATRNLGIIILATLGSYFVLRLLFVGIKNKMQQWARQSQENNRLTRRVVGVVVLSLLDGLALGIAYFVANVVAGYAVGTGGYLSMQGAFFIHAFVVLEGLKIGIRALFYPAYPKLRLIPCNEERATFWQHWFSTLLGLLGYGYLVGYKLISINLSPSMALIFSAVLAISAFIYGMRTVVKERYAVRAALLAWSKNISSPLLGIFLDIFAMTWHWLAGGYFIMLLVLTLLRGANSLPFVLRGTLNTISIIGGGVLLSAFLTQYIKQKIYFPPALKKHFAGVERLLNTYIPILLRVIRFLLLWVVVFAVLSAWGIVDMYGWLNSAAGKAFLQRWSGVALIIFLAAVVWLLAVGIIEHRLSPDTGTGKPSAREHTLLSLFKSGFGVIVFAIAAIMIMSEIGINIGPLVAGAGVLGLAVGFGAQKLVQDVITGIFFQIENAMNAGDIVTVDGITGTAEKISIRTIGIRDLAGTYHLIPFSNVTRVSNYMRGYANHLAEYGIAYRENIDEAITQLKAAFDELVRSDMKRHILEPISIHGVTQLGDNAVMIQISIKTTPGDQWTVGRAYNRLVKLYFDAAGIEIPFPHRQIYFGEDKNGDAPPLNVRQLFAAAHKSPSAPPESAPNGDIDTSAAHRLPGAGEA